MNELETLLADLNTAVVAAESASTARDEAVAAAGVASNLHAEAVEKVRSLHAQVERKLGGLLETRVRQ